MQTNTDSLISKFRNWRTRQQLKKQLIQAGLKPKLVRFEAGELVLVENGKIRLSWEVKNAHKITINNGVGEVEAKGEIYVRIPQNATNYKIQARGGKHKTSQTVPIFPEKFNAKPLSELFSKSNKKSLKLPKVEIDFPKLEREKLNPEQLSNLPELNLPKVPTKPELQKLKSELPESNQLRTVEELQKKFEELKNTDLMEKLD